MHWTEHLSVDTSSTATHIRLAQYQSKIRDEQAKNISRARTSKGDEWMFCGHRIPPTSLVINEA